MLRAQHRAILKGIGGATSTITHQSYLRWLQTQGEYSGTENGVLDSGWLIKEKELHKRRAPGNTCLESLKNGKDFSLEGQINNSKGCGAVMRMAPVGFSYRDFSVTFKLGCELGKLTHGHPSGYLSAGAFSGIIQQLAIGRNVRQAIEKTLLHLKTWPAHHEVTNAITDAIHYAREIDRGSTDSLQAFEAAIQQLGQGWVAEEALAISVFCSLVYEDDFEGGVLASVNHSGDSDSTGSITGNILGLINGLDAIPEKWIRNLKAAGLVRQVGEDLHTWCKSDSMVSDQGWWAKYPGY